MTHDTMDNTNVMINALRTVIQHELALIQAQRVESLGRNRTAELMRAIYQFRKMVSRRFDPVSELLTESDLDHSRKPSIQAMDRFLRHIDLVYQDIDHCYSAVLKVANPSGKHYESVKEGVWKARLELAKVRDALTMHTHHTPHMLGLYASSFRSVPLNPL